MIASGEDVTGVAVADLNGDGLPDVIASLITAGEVRWYANDNTQSFSSYSTFSAGLNGPWSLSLSDLNNDGAVDVIVTVNYAGEAIRSLSVNEAVVLPYILMCGDMQVKRCGSRTEAVALRSQRTRYLPTRPLLFQHLLLTLTGTPGLTFSSQLPQVHPLLLHY